MPSHEDKTITSINTNNDSGAQLFDGTPEPTETIMITNTTPLAPVNTASLTGPGKKEPFQQVTKSITARNLCASE